MIVEKQGPYECALATMGALIGRPLAEVRKVGHAEAGRMGVAFYTNRVLHRVALALDPSQHLATLCYFDSYDRPDARNGCSGAPAVKVLSRRVRKLPAHGRGVIRVVGPARSGHVAPWEDGLVYDPITPETGQTLSYYRKTFPRNWHVDYITQEVK